MTIHLPLPNLESAWDAPLAASRGIAHAISDAADSVVDTASGAIRSTGLRQPSRAARLARSWWMVAAVVAVVVAIVLARRRRSSAAKPRTVGSEDSVAGPGIRDASTTDTAATDEARDNGRTPTHVDDLADV